MMYLTPFARSLQICPTLNLANLAAGPANMYPGGAESYLESSIEFGSVKGVKSTSGEFGLAPVWVTNSSLIVRRSRRPRD
jgi:hypothetical protein